MSAATTDRPGDRPGARPTAAGVRRTAWFALALFSSAFAVFEVFQHGLWTAIAAPALFLAPSLTERTGPRAYNLTHRAAVPFVLLLAYTLSPLTTAWMFNAGLGWLARIACERTAGRGLRHDG